jgi:tetratricopeptide (TPR) repeat protein
MRRLMLGLLMCAVVSAARAGPFEDATAAYDRGDYAEALKWYRKAADQGSASTQFNLGLMYAQGQGVPQDYAEAAKWYRRAADQCLPLAQSVLGNMYVQGQGVPQDYVQAHKWFNLAASCETDTKYRADAVTERDIIAAKMTPAQIAEAQRLAREWKPK